MKSALEDRITEELARFPMLMTLGQFSEATGYSRATGYRLLDEGKLKARYINITGSKRPTIRITRQSVAELMFVWMHNDLKSESA